MKLILLEDVPNLGYKDDVVEVKSGYGRNYLIPQLKAVIATPSALKSLENKLKQQAHKIAKLKAEAEEMAAKLAEVALTIPTKVSENGTIYGGVNAATIAEALKALGHEIDRKKITVKETVKTVGKYQANVQLHKEVAVAVPFEVVAEVEAE